MKKVIDFIIEKKWDLEDYPELIPLLRENFKIKKYDGSDGTEELITAVMFWEKHYEILQSLEEFLKERFKLE